ncbi:YqaA family protein [Planctobacterium marinum]|uniref:YqaA family protein n=1 Tax=Planctobacterium marinum TaxID=1631968 RepID=UPI001E4C25CD|nr:VTT domain-containing protein [Planctobacterium marinum]MCC2604740.1 VTT domain-containing protein [Planctobacterium marinum]
MNQVNTHLADKLLSLARSKMVYPVLVLVSFLESILIPVPLEAILIPLMHNNREKINWLAACALLGCVIGAITGYLVGMLFYEQWAEQLYRLFGDQQSFNQVISAIEAQGFVYILAVGVTPIPFQVAMLGAGVAQYPFMLFLLATLLARGIRYFGLALLVYYFGPAAGKMFKRYKYPMAAAFTLVFIGFLYFQFT